MKLADITARQIEIALNALRAARKKDEAKLKNHEQEARRVSELIQGCEGKISSAKFKTELLERTLAVKLLLTKELENSRDLLIRKMETAKRKDITVAGKERLEREIADFKMSLQRVCPHPLVMWRHGYHGSDTNEHSDAYAGFRKCCVCLFGEYQENGCGSGLINGINVSEEYKTLQDDNRRIIQHYFGKGSEPIEWEPLETLVAKFVDQRIFELVEPPKTTTTKTAKKRD